jgi:hypothetical protein
VRPLAEIPGAFEVIAARRFFAALAERDARILCELLDEAPSFENFDGPIAVDSRAALARTLSGRADDVAYELVDICGSPGSAVCRFLLLVGGVPGVILLEARLGFAGERISSIRVHQPPSPMAN